MILAIDLGSTSFKAALFDGDLTRVGEGACELAYAYGPGGVVELDPVHVMAAVREAVSGAMTGIDPAELTAIAITSQAQTFTITDAAFEPLIPFVSWLDARAGDACEALAQDAALRDFARHVSFPALLPALQLCQVRHLRDVRSDRNILLLPGFLVAHLTGTPVCDRNLAAMSGLYSMELRSWWPAALGACGIETGQLPSLVDVGCVAGKTGAAAAALGLPTDLPVVLAGNDQTAGAYGARVHETDTVLITLGTCQVAYRAPTGPPGADRTTAAGPYPGGGWYAMAADTCGGNLVKWAQAKVPGCDGDRQFDALAETAPPGCHGLTFEVGASGADHAWRNVTTAHTPADHARAVMETLVGRMAGLVHDLCGASLPATIRVAGGGSRSSLWRSLLSDALDRPLVPTEADPLTGAARMVIAAPCRRS